MQKLFFLSIASLLAAGCRPDVNSPDAMGPSRVVQTVIIDGFGVIDPIVQGDRGLRVGLYYDFTPYDSLRINFVATRLTPGASHDHIVIKLGPVFYLRDSIASPQQSFTFLVRRQDLSKPAFSALTFFVPDSGVAMMLSSLRVVGWTLQ